MKNNLAIRPYNPYDRKNVLRLFYLATGVELTTSFYKWRYEHNPFGPLMINLMYDNKKLVGHYAVCPTIGNFFGDDYPLVLSMNTVTHPDYWGKGIFTKLAEDLYFKISENYGIVLVYGFPNINSHYGFIKKLSWNDVFIIPTLTREIKKEKRGTSLKFNKVECADVRFDSLWTRIKKDKRYFFSNARTSKFINWRFIECSQKKYELFVIGSSSEIKAYAVVKEYLNKGKAELDLVDFLIEDNEDGEGFLLGIISFAAKHNYGRINAWIPLGHRLYNCAEKLRFVPELSSTYLSYRLFEKFPTQNSLLQATKWYVTMADSDVY